MSEALAAEIYEEIQQYMLDPNATRFGGVQWIAAKINEQQKQLRAQVVGLRACLEDIKRGASSDGGVATDSSGIEVNTEGVYVPPGQEVWLADFIDKALSDTATPDILYQEAAVKLAESVKIGQFWDEKGGTDNAYFVDYELGKQFQDLQQQRQGGKV